MTDEPKARTLGRLAAHTRAWNGLQNRLAHRIAQGCVALRDEHVETIDESELAPELFSLQTDVDRYASATGW